jgi:hypothetical protein
MLLQIKRAHPFAKELYACTNHQAYVKQITKLERVTAHACAISHHLILAPVPKPNPSVHHVIADSSKQYYYLSDFVQDHIGDPAATVRVTRPLSSPYLFTFRPPV